MELNKLNKEQADAYQAQINKNYKKFLKTLPAQEKEKFQTVEKVVKILEKSNIPFFLFPYLPWDVTGNGNNQFCMWQWNSNGELVELDENEKLTKKSNKILSEIHMGLIRAVFGAMTEGPQTTGLTKMQKLELFGEYLNTALADEMDDETNNNNNNHDDNEYPPEFDDEIFPD